MTSRNDVNEPFSILAYYEIVSGLGLRDAHRQLAGFLELAAQSNILPLTEGSVLFSADIYANLRARGEPIDDIDILVAGVALANGLVLATHNTSHFGRIEGLQVEDWSLE